MCVCVCVFVSKMDKADQASASKLWDNLLILKGLCVIRQDSQNPQNTSRACSCYSSEELSQPHYGPVLNAAEQACSWLGSVGNILTLSGYANLSWAVSQTGCIAAGSQGTANHLGFGCHGAQPLGLCFYFPTVTFSKARGRKYENSRTVPPCAFGSLEIILLWVISYYLFTECSLCTKNCVKFFSTIVTYHLHMTLGDRKYYFPYNTNE